GGRLFEGVGDPEELIRRETQCSQRDAEHSLPYIMLCVSASLCEKNWVQQKTRPQRNFPDAALSASAGWTGGHPAVFSNSFALCGSLHAFALCLGALFFRQASGFLIAHRHLAFRFRGRCGEARLHEGLALVALL